MAELLKALAHPVRLCIMYGLVQQGPCNVTHIQHCLDIPQSTVSQHLARLRTAGLIVGRRSGVEVHYEVVDPFIKDLVTMVVTANPPYISRE
ncbi:MAG TPA: winged helix-turn-helix transcriptional regulator [Firmicutes bacterium]|nr:winged helix-turn-helix transcriptional regulator [Bacillota bacterium]